ncbi:MAG: MFS transporter [Dehalococcoidia bacterium]
MPEEPRAAVMQPGDAWVVEPLPPVSWLPERLSPVRYRDFRLLLAGLLMALSGWWMIIVAQGWLVLELTDSAAAVTLVGAMLSLPFLFLAPLSGVMADRLYRKHLLVGTRSTVAVLMFIEGALILSGHIEVWQMVVLAFLAGCAFAADIPARQSLIPDTVPPSLVANAVALNVSMFSITTIAGPILGAGTLAWAGAGGCFIANGFGNAALAASIALMRVPRRQRAGRLSVSGDFVSGLRYVRGQRVLLTLLSVSLVVTMTGRNWQQLAPVFVRDVFDSGEGGLGLLYTMAGIGAVIGAAFLVAVSHWRRRAGLYGVGLTAAFLAIALFAISPSLEVALGAVLVVGVGLQVTETTTQTVLLVETPEEFRGRMMSLSSLIWGLQPLGVLVAGVIADAASPQAAILAGCGAGVTLLAALYTRTRRVWATF